MPSPLFRRDFARLAASAAAGATSVPGRAADLGSAHQARELSISAGRLPALILWGSATAPYQVEGAVHRVAANLLRIGTQIGTLPSTCSKNPRHSCTIALG